jgi:hypothetical protein
MTASKQNIIPPTNQAKFTGGNLNVLDVPRSRALSSVSTASGRFRMPYQGVKKAAIPRYESPLSDDEITKKMHQVLSALDQKFILDQEIKQIRDNEIEREKDEIETHNALVLS